LAAPGRDGPAAGDDLTRSVAVGSKTARFGQLVAFGNEYTPESDAVHLRVVLSIPITYRRGVRAIVPRTRVALHEDVGRTTG